MFIKVKIQNIKIICPFSPSEGTTLSKDSYNIQNSKTELLSPQIDTGVSVKLPGVGDPSEERRGALMTWFVSNNPSLRKTVKELLASGALISPFVQLSAFLACHHK